MVFVEETLCNGFRPWVYHAENFRDEQSTWDLIKSSPYGRRLTTQDQLPGETLAVSMAVPWFLVAIHCVFMIVPPFMQRDSPSFDGLFHQTS